MSGAYYPPLGGSGLTSPVAVADGGTGAATAAAARRALLGCVAPPALSGWTAVTADETGEGTGYIYVGRNATGSVVTGQIHRAAPSSASDVGWTLTARIHSDPTRFNLGAGIVLRGSGADAFLLFGRFAYDDGRSDLSAAIFTSPTATSGSVTWATLGQARNAASGSIPLWLRVTRAVGGALTFQSRPDEDVPWSTHGTTANDAAAIGIATRVQSIGIGVYANAGSIGGRLHRAFCTSWEVT